MTRFSTLPDDDSISKTGAPFEDIRLATTLQTVAIRRAAEVTGFEIACSIIVEIMSGRANWSARSFAVVRSDVTAHQCAGNQRPSVSYHEKGKLERKRDDSRWHHHHTH